MMSLFKGSVGTVFFMILSSMLGGSESFSTPLPCADPRSFSSSSSSSSPSWTTRLNEGRLETIEFKIFPDGRVQEVVRGVKGESCNSVTEQINEALGQVYESAPTEEMFEQEIVIDNTNTLTNSASSSSSSDSSWEGSSSW